MNPKHLENETRKLVSELCSVLADNNYSLIPTSRNLFALSDTNFENSINKHRWFAVISKGHIYAVADISGKRVSLQRYVLSLASNGKSLETLKHISFKNKISFDCRLSNLTKEASRQSVMRNRLPKKNTSSQYKGVRKKVRTHGDIYWQAQIKGELGTMSLGAFDDERDAARHYDAAASLLFGEAAYHNFPDRPPTQVELQYAKNKIEKFKRFKSSKTN